MPSLTDFIPDATREERDQLEQALLRGETLRWAVRPVPRAWARNTLALFLVSFPWLGLTGAGIWGIFGAPKTLAEFRLPTEIEKYFILIFLGIFWLLGLGMFLSPWLQKRGMRQTLYALTDRRALVMESGETTPYKLHGDLLRERKRRAGGRGDLLFYTGRTRDTSESAVGFLNVPDVREAEERLDAAVRAAQGAKCERI